MTTAENILMKKELSREDLIYLLLTGDETEHHRLYAQARMATKMHCGNKVHLRGLIEISNQCKKDCLYCGIRAGNNNASRYILDTSSIMRAAEHAWRKGFGSVVIQAGERQDRAFTSTVTDLIRKIRKLGRNELGITLSCGEQDDAVYKEWLDAGAHRYLLRIETSNEKLYRTIHPDNERHDFNRRLHALKTLQRLGYQTGTGVMVGLPGQTVEHLADDLLFMKEFGIDMAGLGPYIPHPETPLFSSRDDIPEEGKRLELSLKMIALLRLLLKDINIAASTALQTLDTNGRLKAIASGANVFMPNLTPPEQAGKYTIYSGKPIFTDMAETALISLEKDIEDMGFEINYYSRGDSKHYYKRIRDN